MSFDATRPGSVALAVVLAILIGAEATPTAVSFRALVLDLEGDGLFLTDRSYAVALEIEGSRRLVTWTSTGHEEGFLWLDADDDRRPSAEELLGSGIRERPDPAGTGFVELGDLDRDPATGNGDGRLDDRDPVWPQLRLWIDRDHDALPRSGELKTLQRCGIRGLGIEPEIFNRVDGGLNLHASWTRVEWAPARSEANGARVTEVYFRILEPSPTEQGRHAEGSAAEPARRRPVGSSPRFRRGPRVGRTRTLGGAVPPAA